MMLAEINLGLLQVSTRSFIAVALLVNILYTAGEDDRRGRSIDFPRVEAIGRILALTPGPAAGHSMCQHPPLVGSSRTASFLSP